MGRAARIAATLAFLLCVFPLTAEPERRVVVGFSSAAPDAQLEDVLYISLGVEFSNAGFSTSKVGKETKEAPYFLTADYALRGATTDVRLILSSAKTGGAILATIDFVLHLDTSFDADVAEGVSRLLALAAVDAPKKEAAVPEIGGLFQSDLITLDAMLRTDRKIRLELVFAGGVAPFLGNFSDYSSYGACGTAQAGVLFLKRNWSLSAGGRFALTRAFMMDGVTGGPVYLSTAGVNVQFGVGAAQRHRLAVCASGGAAVITVPDGIGYLSKTVPYADGGVQAGFPLRKDLFLGGDLRLLAVFDPSVLVLGVAASLSVCKEF